MTIEERFWSKVDTSDGWEDCWVWRAQRTAKGYGKFRFRGTMWRAHRVAYVLTHGEIPEGLLVCHTCDNPPCCNPTHLFAGTVSDNGLDSVAKGRHWTHQQPERVIAGSAHFRAKMTEAIVAEARAAHARGRRIVEIADTYGVSKTTIERAIRRDTWKHVP